MNNADPVVRMLKAAGIRHGFGVPSGNVLPLMDGARLDRSPLIALTVLTRTLPNAGP